MSIPSAAATGANREALGLWRVTGTGDPAEIQAQSKLTMTPSPETFPTVVIPAENQARSKSTMMPPVTAPRIKIKQRDSPEALPQPKEPVAATTKSLSTTKEATDYPTSQPVAASKSMVLHSDSNLPKKSITINVEEYQHLAEGARKIKAEMKQVDNDIKEIEQMLDLGSNDAFDLGAVMRSEESVRRDLRRAIDEKQAKLREEQEIWKTCSELVMGLHPVIDEEGY